MKKLCTLVALTALAAACAWADVKATVQIENTVCMLNTVCASNRKGSLTCPSAPTNWIDVEHTSLATSNSVSINSIVSLVTGILTDVKGLTNVVCTSASTGLACTSTTTDCVCSLGPSGGTATGEIQVLLVMDGHCSGGACTPGAAWDGDGTAALPNGGGAGVSTAGITYQENVETLTVVLGQIFTACGTTADTGAVVCTSCGALCSGATPAACCTAGPGGTNACSCSQSVDLQLQNTEAHAFGFVLPNVGVTPNKAPHLLDVFAQVTQANFVQNASGSGSGKVATCIGQGSIIADVAGLGHGFNCSSSSCSAQ